MFKDNVKKILIYLIVVVFVSTSIVIVYLKLPDTFKDFNSRMTDYMFILRGEIKGSENIVIIDIDEKSLNQIGQWPWSRDTVAKLVDNLTNNGVGLIGLDIVFAESDRTSPSLLAKKLHITKDKDKFPDYDVILASTISKSPVILGYQFEMTDKEFIKKDEISIPATFIEKHKQQLQDYVLKAKGTILNTPAIQNAAYSSGFFNNIPDPSGVIRSVPLIISYNNQIYPSLVLEMIRAANNINKVYINYNELGVENIQLGDFYIPTDRYGRLLINFRGKEKSYKYISAVDVVEGKIAKEELNGKIVIVGTSAAGLLDLRATPFEAIYPGVEVHANALENILNNQVIMSPAWIDGANILYITVITFFGIFLVAYLALVWVPIVLSLLFIVIIAANYYMLFAEHIAINTFFPLVALIVATVISLMINYFFEIKQKELIKQKFSSKVSKSVMEDILKSGNSDFLSAKDKEVTIFFSDIRGFTSISEAMPSPRALIDYLNRYLNPITEIIINNEGTIDKYIGDAVMAYWNAPSDVANHQDKALKASLEQFAFLKKLNETLTQEQQPIVEIGIGINTGFVTVGEMGSMRRSDYTVIGDPINLGSRLESLCKGYGAKLIISEFTKSGLKEEYLIRKLDLVRVKGKTEPVEIFEVHDYLYKPLLNNIDYEIIKKEVESFNEAVLMYRNSDFVSAKNIFEDIKSKYKPLNNKICDIYMDRCAHYIEIPPKDFDGVFTHTTKG